MDPVPGLATGPVSLIAKLIIKVDPEAGVLNQWQFCHLLLKNDYTGCRKLDSIGLL